MALVTNRWIGGANADWGASAANWSRGLPASNNKVVIDTSAVLTVFYGSSDTAVVHSLTVGQDFFDMSGGSLTIGANARFADGFTQTGGTLTAGGEVTVNGTGVLSGGTANGKTAFTFDGTVALANYTLAGAAILDNKKATNETGQITLGDNTGVGATIANEKGGIFAIAGDFGIGQGAASARFLNAGIFTKTAGSNTSFIAVDFTDSGSIVAASGTLEFGGPQNRFAGSIAGRGQVYLGNGSKDTITRGTSVKVALFTVSDNSTVVALEENLSYARAFTIQNNATFDLIGTVTFTLSGTNTFAGAVVEAGDGLLVTAHGSKTDINGLTIGGPGGWQNSGFVGEVATLQLGDPTFNAVQFLNLKGGVYAFAADVGIARGNAENSGFVNEAGARLEKIGGGNGSVVGVDYSGAGAIRVGTGTIELAGVDNSVAGTVSGRGEFVLGGGTNLIERGAVLDVATFGISGNGTEVTLGENLDYTGAFDFEDGSALNLGGFTLTLAGASTFLAANFGFPSVEGAGALVTAHGSNTSVNGFTIAGAMDWENHGVVDGLGSLTVGDPNDGFGKTTFINEPGGVYNFQADAGIAIGLVANSRFVNDHGALLEKTAGTGDSVIAPLFTNDGVVRVNSGKVEFQRPIDGSGSFTIDPQTVLQFDNAVAKGAAVDFAGKKGGELLLFDGPQFAAAVHGFGGKGTDQIDLGDIDITGVRLRYAGNRKEGVLSATSGTATARLTMFGNYTRADFHVSADPFGGTLITDSAARAALLASGS